MNAENEMREKERTCFRVVEKRWIDGERMNREVVDLVKMKVMRKRHKNTREKYVMHSSDDTTREEKKRRQRARRHDKTKANDQREGERQTARRKRKKRVFVFCGVINWLRYRALRANRASRYQTSKQADTRFFPANRPHLYPLHDCVNTIQRRYDHSLQRS